MRKLTDHSRHLLLEIATGRDRIFYMDDCPHGWRAIERAGYAVRDPNNDTRALLTPEGSKIAAALYSQSH